MTHLLLVSLIAVPQTQKTLTIGDPAPPLNAEAWLKGKPTKLAKGKVYVVEFWATWCGPCIQAMPHLSDAADRLRGKVEFIGVNVIDRKQAGEDNSGSKTHRERITKWVREHNDKIRYSVALDDSKDTIFRNWMVAAGQGGIPCSFVVDQKGRIAWIGHPETGVDRVAELVTAGKFDIEKAKSTYFGSMKGTRTEAAEKAALVKLAKSGDLAAVEKAYLARTRGSRNFDLNAASTIVEPLSRANAQAALGFVKNRLEGDMADSPTLVEGFLVYISPNFKGNAKAATDLIALSQRITDLVPKENIAIQSAYHGRVLLALGDLAGARTWLEKATSELPLYRPAEYRDNMKKYIDDSKKRVELAAQKAKEAPNRKGGSRI